ncbi:replicative DNA helicase [Peptoniphilus asaccharolyticus DSM 20463]|uniref:Replicative DNA helicase n=1 Tax=Peptoniphilus asaccharolyticus DSM 20463 TaxID=573058 RepID=A0A1W1V502_PEPAS|nr:replicative DNA helicase [Peptoniphilus asaccharolyticus]MBL7576350.1 replicative DNA helicase [Peptoniphilus asaccharolyticus]SMB88487.1 replicative DNA helicase [Peptoniphilus asaccharolyticus DSM 20463]
MEELNLKVPPHVTETEQSVLGAMMLSKDAITSAVEILKAEDFYSEIHGEIYSAITSIYNRNVPADVMTIVDELKKRDSLEEVGGLSYIVSLSSAAGLVSNTKYHCEIIKEKSTLRKLIAASDQTMSSAYAQDADLDMIIEKAESSIFNITQASHRIGLSPIKETLLESFAAMEKRAQNPNALTGVTTGFEDLDRQLSGLQKSDLVLLAARPSMGKTALMVNIATNAALRAKAKVAMFSLEMSKTQLVDRIIASIAHVDLQKIISGNLTADDWERVVNAMPIISELDIEIDDTAGISPLELKAKCRRQKMEKGLDLVVIDYLQLMQMSEKVESRTQEISAISRNLKAIAKELEVPVLALSQLSRSPEMRADHRPILSDLRESGAIEQDADVVMFLFRDEYYTKEESEKPNIGEVIIAKHRNGPTGTVELIFRKEFTKFLNKEYGA